MAKKSTRSTGRPTTKASAKKAVASRPSATYGPRRLKPAPPKAFRFHKPIRHPVKLPSVWRITRTAALIMWNNKSLFLGIIAIYALLTLGFIPGLMGNSNATSLKASFDHLAHGNFGAFTSSLGVFTVLVGSAANSSSPTAGPYQLAFALITSLAIIWALRQIIAGKKIRIRDTYYYGMYPLVPFILVLLVIGLQLVPFVVGTKLYVTIINGGIAAHTFEKVFWFIVFVLLSLWSLYMISASVFALYIVTLVDMTPLKALRSAREIARHRRWTLLRKILCLPLILLIVAAVIMLPVILVLTPLAPWILFLLGMAVLVAVHAYMYTLYRELLNE